MCVSAGTSGGFAKFVRGCVTGRELVACSTLRRAGGCRPLRVKLVCGVGLPQGLCGDAWMDSASRTYDERPGAFT